MDRDVVATKLESLGRCVARIESKTPATPESLRADLDAIVYSIVTTRLGDFREFAEAFVSRAHREDDRT